MTLARSGYSEPFYSQGVSFDLQDRQLQLPMPRKVAPGFYEVSVKPPKRLAARRPMPVYGAEISADFNDAGPSAFALGDADQYGGDNLINVLDVGTISAHWQQDVETHPGARVGDLNDDGVVDSGDWAILMENYSKSGMGPVGLIEDNATTDHGPTLSLQTQTTTHKVGDTFTVSINLVNVTDTYGTGVILHYDSTYLEVQDADSDKPGTQIASSANVYPICHVNSVDPLGDTIRLSSSTQPGATARGGGLLGTVTFKALASVKDTAVAFDFFPGKTADSNVVGVDSQHDILSTVAGARIRVDGTDTTPPTGGLIINGGADFTNQRRLGLVLDAKDAYGRVAQMRFSGSSGSWDPWQSFAYETTRQVSAGDGPKTLYAQLSDESGNTTVMSSTIVLDTASPTGTIQVTDFEEDRKAVYRVTADDGPGTVEQMLISQDPLFIDAEWSDYSGANLVADPEHGRTIYARLKDEAGNVSEVISQDLLVADFVAEPRCGKAPLDVEFTDNSVGEVTSWQWDFGDGGRADEQQPVHTYTNTGRYTVALKVSGAQSDDVITRTDHIYVSADGRCDTSTLTIVNRGTTVDFEGDLEAFTLGPDESTTFEGVPFGTCTLVEQTAPLSGPSWILSDVICRTAEDQPVAVDIDRDEKRADIPIGLDQQLTCTFVNKLESKAEIYLPVVLRNTH